MSSSSAGAGGRQPAGRTGRGVRFVGLERLALGLALLAGPPVLSQGEETRSAAAAGAETSPAPAIEWDPTIEERWLRRPASLGIENGYRDTMVAWSKGLASAAARYAAFQVDVVEDIGGARVTPSNFLSEEVARGIQCLGAIEANTIGLLEADDPEVLAAAYAFQFEVYLEQLGHPHRVWLVDAIWSRLERLRHDFRGRPGAPPKGQDEMLALLLIETGARLEELGFVGQLARARESFERAIEHAPGSIAGRYRAGILAEKLGLYRRAARHFEWLGSRRPGDFEVRLRRALVRGRLGEREEMLADLDGLTRSRAPEWIRVLAWEEVARHRAIDDRADAVATLRQALAELPGRRGLKIQLAYYLGPTRVEGRRILERLVEDAHLDHSESPRAVYEEGRRTELTSARERFAVELEKRRSRLVAAMERLERQEQIKGAFRRHRGLGQNVRTVFFECRGYKKKRRP